MNLILIEFYEYQLTIDFQILQLSSEKKPNEREQTYGMRNCVAQVEGRELNEAAVGGKIGSRPEPN